MNYATIKEHDTANGPGVRVSLFVSGCTHGCKGCFNPEAWDFNYGKPFTQVEEEQIINALEPWFMRGLSLLGGEPFEPENQKALLPFLRKLHATYPDKTIWCYTGYDFEKDLLTGRLCDWEITQEMLSYIDVLIDGEFKIDLKNPDLRFRGSSNQRVIDIKKSLAGDELVRWDEN